MAWLSRAWPVLRDVVILGTGTAIVWVQLIIWALSARPPSPQLMALAAGLLGIPGVSHARALARGGDPGPSSPSSPPPSPPQSPRGSPPTAVPGEPGA